MPILIRSRRALHRLAGSARPRAAEAAPEADAIGPLAALGLTLEAGLACGGLQLGCERARWALLGHESWLGLDQVNPHYLWMAPASTVLVFAPVAVALAFWAWARPARWFGHAAAAAIVFLAALTLLSTVRVIHPFGCALLAAGLARVGGPWLGARADAVRHRARRARVALLLLAAGLPVISTAHSAWREWRTARALPAPRRDAPNVLLIVLDAVRADALSAYGAPRDTTPFLKELARDGVRFENARATAPWTLPSHASLFTGRFPSEFRVGVKRPLDAAHPTLAEFLAAHGYATAGFAANYVYCTWNYGLPRGFAHYEGRTVSFDDVLGSSPLGRGLFPYLDALRYAAGRWAGFGDRPNATDPRIPTRRRDAAAINQAFRRWLRGRDGGRPFFVFLNYFDAHSPCIVPSDRYTPFGLRPDGPDDYRMLRDYDRNHTAGHDPHPAESEVSPREHALVRDGYDDCLAYIDRQLRHLFHALQRDGTLENTLVIITSDHGEQFGEHGLRGHSISVHRKELDVPLLVVWPRRVPRGRTVAAPVSLRNVPATVAELAGLGREAPFPGRSLAAHWDGRARGLDTAAEPVYSELTEYGVSALRAGETVYIRARGGAERLYDLANDAGEDRDRSGLPESGAAIRRFRALLASVGGTPAALDADRCALTRLNTEPVAVAARPPGGADPSRR
jgi:arylsulfatase A-like enzyme